jgi:hypothetical protein
LGGWGLPVSHGGEREVVLAGPSLPVVGRSRAKRGGEPVVRELLEAEPLGEPLPEVGLERRDRQPAAVGLVQPVGGKAAAEEPPDAVAPWRSGAAKAAAAPARGTST